MKVKRFSVFLFLFILGTVNLAFAHPHVFVSPKSKLFFDSSNNLKKIRVIWYFDSMTSVQIMQAFDRNRNGRLDRREVNFIRQKVLPGLAQFHYYTFLKTDGRSLRTIRPINFKAYAKRRRKLVYQFDIAINKKVSKNLKLLFEDQTIYVAFELFTKNIEIVGANGLKSKKIKDNQLILAF